MADRKKAKSSELAKENLKSHMGELASCGEKSKWRKYTLLKAFILFLILLSAFGLCEAPPFILVLCELILFFIYLNLLKNEAVDRISHRVACLLREKG